MVWQTEKWSIVVFFIVSSPHHTFGDKIGSVTIINTFRVSVGKPLGLSGLLLGTLFEVLFLPLLKGTE